MRKLTQLIVGVVAGFAGVVASPAASAAVKTGATVSLSLSDGDATPSSVIVVPGSTFTVTASLTTSTKLTGVDYYLQASGAASGKLRITGRSLGNSLLADPVKANVGDNGSNPGVLDLIASTLKPRNLLDLGASVDNVNVPVNAGTYALATYTISVPATLTPGTYTLSTTSDAGSGWVETAPLFNEWSFNSQGAFTVTVQAPGAGVPEPGVVGIVGVVAAGWLGRRR